MDYKRILIRVDGDSVMGMGHVYRCLALAEILKNEFEVIFVSKTNMNCEPIQNSEFYIKFIPESIILKDEPKLLRESFSNEYFVVLDGYQFTHSYQQQIRDEGFKLFYIDDLMEENQVADTVINHCPGITIAEYSISEHTKLALGLNYVLLRKSFLNFDRESTRKISTIQSVLVSFGGSNPGGFSYKSVEQLLELEELKEIHVLGGSSADFSSLIHSKNTSLTIHSSLNEEEVFNLMKSVDLAVVPASTVSLELASVGVPMILGYFIDNQKFMYKGLKDVNSVFGIGDYNSFDFTNLNQIVNRLNNTQFLNTDNMVSLFNERSNNNILNLFKQVALSARDVVLEDLKFVFDLANDSLIRANSYDSDKINIEQHTLWFNNQLNAEKKAFYIMEYKGCSIGQVRFSFYPKHTVIGVSIAEKYRGLKLGSEILKKAVIKYFENYQLPIYAYIKQSNIPSIKSFERAGFKFFRNENIKGVDSFLYKREIN